MEAWLSNRYAQDHYFTNGIENVSLKVIRSQREGAGT